MHTSQISNTIELLQNLQDYLELEKRMFDCGIVATAIQILIRESGKPDKWLSDSKTQVRLLYSACPGISQTGTRS